jgi:hypothetical protein
LLCIAVLIWANLAQAQLPNNIFHDYLHQDSLHQTPDKLSLDVNSLFFFRNNEFFNNIDPGQTLFGYLFQPQLRWKPISGHPELELRGGAFAHKDFGNDSFTTLQPTLSLVYQYNKTKFIFGTLEGGLNHRLIEPLYQFERGLYQRLENGFQVVHNSDRLWVDGWVNWVRNTHFGSEDQEIILTGLSGIYRLYKNKKTISGTPASGLQLIPQFTVYHRGGTFNKENVVNRSNGALGIRYHFHQTEKNFFFIEPYCLYSLDHSPELTQPFSDGWAMYLNAGKTWDNFTIMASYFNSWEYISSIGMPMMSSFSWQNYYSLERERALLFLRFIYTKEVIHPNFNIDLRAEPIYDFNNNQFDYNFGVYFSFRKNIGLDRKK